MHESKLQTAQLVQVEGECFHQWRVKQRERKVVQQSCRLVASVGAEEKFPFRTMTETVWFLFLAMLNFLGSVFIQTDTEVTCVHNQSCILPCMFHMDSVSIVHWIHMTDGEPHAHFYNSKKNQVNQQDPHFRGRTSLFKDQLSRGNASLLLTGVKVQDEGKYKCFVFTENGNKQLYVYLKIEAPVSAVNILHVDNRIICSSDGIYPQPEVSWSTEPPSNTALKSITSSKWTEQQLYNISSSLIFPDGGSDLTYSCTVSTRSNKITQIFKKPVPVSTVSVSQDGNRITCSSEGIYPQPELTWSTEPPSNTALKYTSVTKWTEQQLYNISSSLSVSDSDLIYSCSVSTTSSKIKMIVNKPISTDVKNPETIPCISSNMFLSSFMWKFNHSQVILLQTESGVSYDAAWRKHVKKVSDSGDLTLQDLSSAHEGIYTCEVQNEEETIRSDVLLRIHPYTEVTCVHNQSCILPCMFHMDSVSIVHWIHMTDGEPHAHFYNSKKNQVNQQDPHFRGRTSLFKDQLSRGDASLLLTGVKVQDEGKYKCCAIAKDGRKELSVYLNVEAPVSEVKILQVENRIICSSDGIHPKPELSWSTIPPFTSMLKYSSTVNWTEQQLYNISSSLVVSDRGSDWIYSCTVRTRSNKVTKFLIWNVSEETVIAAFCTVCGIVLVTLSCSVPRSRNSGK